MENTHDGKGGKAKELMIATACVAGAVFVALVAHTFVKPHITAFVHSKMDPKDAALATAPAAVQGTAPAAAKA